MRFESPRFVVEGGVPAPSFTVINAQNKIVHGPCSPPHWIPTGFSSPFTVKRSRRTFKNEFYRPQEARHLEDHKAVNRHIKLPVVGTRPF
jgi:hypothetical protein